MKKGLRSQFFFSNSFKNRKEKFDDLRQNKGYLSRPNDSRTDWPGNRRLGARAHERTEERKGYANGYKPKEIQTRMGALELEVPQVRGLSFYPRSIEKGTRSEKALKLAIAQMYLEGVSTRRVQDVTEKVTQELDGEFEQFRNRPIGEISYLIFDAVDLKVRHCGSVVDMAILLAYGVTPEGKREILGASASLSEAEVHWRDFFKHLQSRGLRGLRLIVS